MTKKIVIRPSDRDDYARIVELISDPDELFLVFPGGQWPFTLKQVHRLSQQRLNLTTCLVADEPVGFANLYDLSPGNWVYIGNVVVRADQRGTGIGRRLLEHMLGIVFIEYALPQARISVFSDNTPALRLYESLGFIQFDEENRSGPRGGRVTLLHLKLNREDAALPTQLHDLQE